MLFNTIVNLKLLKIDQKMLFLKTWKKFRKSGNKFEKMSDNPENSTCIFMRIFILMLSNLNKLILFLNKYYWLKSFIRFKFKPQNLKSQEA